MAVTFSMRPILEEVIEMEMAMRDILKSTRKVKLLLFQCQGRKIFPILESSAYIPNKPSFEGINDLVIFILDSKGSNLIYSSFLGGDGEDISWGMEMNSKEEIFITGYTNSDNFPTTASAYQANLKNNSRDIFVIRFDPAIPGTAGLRYSTLFGGSGSDEAYDIAISRFNNRQVAVVGRTIYTEDFPILNAYDSEPGAGSALFVFRLDTEVPGTNGLVFSTFVKGSNTSFGEAIVFDKVDDIYFGGWTTSPDYPMVNALDNSLNGVHDMFISKLNATGDSLLYSTFFGGDEYDALEGPVN